MTNKQKEPNLKNAINGYIFANLPDVDVNTGDRVRWHLLGMGNEVDLHTPHWHAALVKINGQYTDVAELLPASMKSADMVADNPGPVDVSLPYRRSHHRWHDVNVSGA
jgi:hypothetical protein